MVRRGLTQYTQIGDAVVAYQVTGDGPVDLVYLRGIYSNVDVQWDVPPLARALERLGSFSRLITFDRRGVGISDPVRLEAIGSWERWLGDLLAVLEVTESRTPAILAEFDAAPVAQLFAATYPDRIRALVMWNGYAKVEWASDYPVGAPRAAHRAIDDAVAEGWGTLEFAERALGESSRTSVTVEAVAKLQRSSATPTRVRALLEFQAAIDTRQVLPTIRAPTLALARERFPFVPARLSRFVADQIQGARFQTFPGTASDLWAGQDADEIIDTIETFLTGAAPAASHDRVLATIVFTDIVASTERVAAIRDRAWSAVLDAHDDIAATTVAAFGGKLVKTTGDGMLAIFDGPARALTSVFALERSLAEHGLSIRAGVHCGEIELRGDSEIGGIAVHIAARVMDTAHADEILCSRTVKDLTVGSPIGFEDRGAHALKGVPDDWHLFAAKQL